MVWIILVEAIMNISVKLYLIWASGSRGKRKSLRTVDGVQWDTGQRLITKP